MSKRKPYIVTEKLPNSTIVASVTDSLLGQPALVIADTSRPDAQPLILGPDQTKALIELVSLQFPKVAANLIVLP